MAIIPPSYSQVIDYYLRDDVSTLLWTLSQRRPLTFYHHSDVDLSRGGPEAHRTPHGIRLHCVADVPELQRRVVAAAAGTAEHSPGFTPFFGMGHVANQHGAPAAVIGWDMRFELDFDLETSFRALLPVLAVLDHFGVPSLAKYSGHRSLHLVIPAEAFPAAMRRSPDHRQWMETFQLLGDLFCQLSPHLDRGSTRTAKEMVLTAPYSFHRWFGRLSVPLTLAEALEFDAGAATLERFAGVDWHPDELRDDTGRMLPLLELARRHSAHPDELVALARQVFAGPAWERHFGSARGDAGAAADPAAATPLVATLVAGLPAINDLSAAPALDAERSQRLAAARLAMDQPAAKELKFYRLIGPVGFGVPEETVRAVRLALATALARWVRDGLDAALAHALGLAKHGVAETPVTCGVRLLELLPDTDDRKVEALLRRWPEGRTAPAPVSALVALALGERSATNGAALAALCRSPADAAGSLAQAISRVPWQTERRPDLAVATLALAYGQETVAGWLQTPEAPIVALIQAIFGTDPAATLPPKFTFAVQRLLAPAAAD